MANKFTRRNMLKYFILIPILILLIQKYIRNGSELYLLITFLVCLTAFVLHDLMSYRSIVLIENERNTYAKEIDDLNKRIIEQEDKLEKIESKPLPSGTNPQDCTKKLNDMQNELKLKNDELWALRDASVFIASTFNVNAMIAHIYKAFNRFTGCDRFLICFIQKDTENLICKYEVGDVTYNEVGKLYEEDTSIRKCFDDKQPIVKINIRIERRNCYGDKMAIPLSASGEPIGVIFIESGIPESFTNINLNFLESMANMAAVAIKNAELFNDAFVQKQEIEALYEETAAVNEQLNINIEELNYIKEELREKNEELTMFYDNIQTGYFQTVMALANSIEAKDAYTRGHCQRVMEISCEIAKEMGYADEDIENLKYAAILHDIGKIGIPASIIHKQGKLTDEEYEEIKKHPLISYNILKDVEFIKDGLDAILQHHERYDGKGYPHGLAGEGINVFARILCIADAFDAMTSDRPYRKGMDIKGAIMEIERCQGSQFDPRIAQRFIQMSNAILESENMRKGDLDVE